MKKSKHTLWVLLVGLLLGAGIAVAGEPQTGELRAKNVANSTVTIGDRVYQVVRTTEIIDQKGDKITLAQLKLDSDPEGGMTLFAEFVAAGDELERLKVMDLPQ